MKLSLEPLLTEPTIGPACTQRSYPVRGRAWRRWLSAWRWRPLLGLCRQPTPPAAPSSPGGWNGLGQTSVPPGSSGVVAVAAGDYHNLALKIDGTIVAWGDNTYGQTSVPSGLSGVIAVAGGGYHSLALKSRRYGRRLGLWESGPRTM